MTAAPGVTGGPPGGAPGTPARRGVRMSDVAREVGVSAQTVSRVANGAPGVGEPTRRVVVEAMQRLGYRPNSAARALKSGRFRSIGVLLFTLSTVGNVRTLDGILASAATAGYGITVVPVQQHTQEEVSGAFSRLTELAVDAVVVVMEVQLLDTMTVLLPPGVPVVVVDSDAGSRYPVVDTDQADGTRQAVRHLLDLGHATVWHVAGPQDSFAAGTRAGAWAETLRAAGREVPPPLVGDWSSTSGYEAGRRLARESGCTAVFSANDQMALGVMRALREAGRRVPEDVSVVGFDDLPDAGDYAPPLTTVHQDFHEVGRLCVDLALRQVADGAAAPGTTLVPTRLVVRASTAPPPAPRPDV